MDDKSVYLLRGVFGDHHFLPGLTKRLLNLRERIKKRKASNIDLDANLYEQVRLTYAVPRNISVISLGRDSLYNMFPTDLHGPVSEKHYISSLRIGGKANAQVETLKQLAISMVQSDFYEQAYELGRNHMRALGR